MCRKASNEISTLVSDVANLARSIGEVCSLLDGIRIRVETLEESRAETERKLEDISP